MKVRVRSPVVLVETIGGYSASGVLILLYYQALATLPQVLGEDPWPIFWLVELLPLLGVLLWLWVAIYSGYQAWSFTKVRWGSSVAVIVGISVSLVGAVTSTIVLTVLLIDQVGFLDTFGSR